MNDDNILPLLQRWADTITTLEAAMAALREAVGGSSDSKFADAVYRTADLAADMVSLQVGDTGDWLSWFQYDNLMGERGLAAGYGENPVPVRTLEDLAALIAEGREGE